MSSPTDSPEPSPGSTGLSQRDAGLRAFARGEYSLAAELLLPCAEAGEVKAQLLLARMYYAGNGVAADPAKYQYWLERAAASGDKSARAKLKRLQGSR
jgi:TPR repeat protein